jgi:hypothetical protein
MNIPKPKLTIRCATCFYRGDGCQYKKIHNIESDVFSYCLIKVSGSERLTFKHRNFPNLCRSNRDYQYIYWKPKTEINDILLTDEDFEI